MTTEQYRDWIRTQLLDMASSRYPNMPHKQILYQIGFLQAQLAQAMAQDSRTADRFKSAVDNKQ